MYRMQLPHLASSSFYVLPLKVLAELQADGLFSFLEPDDVASLRLACQDFCQLVDSCFTPCLHLSPLPSSDKPHPQACIQGHCQYDAAKAQGAALGRYHSRLTDAHTLYLHASSNQATSTHLIQAFMAGYIAPPGLLNTLAHIRVCCLTAAKGAAPINGGLSLGHVGWAPLHVARVPVALGSGSVPPNWSPAYRPGDSPAYCPSSPQYDPISPLAPQHPCPGPGSELSGPAHHEPHTGHGQLQGYPLNDSSRSSPQAHHSTYYSTREEQGAPSLGPEVLSPAHSAPTTVWSCIAPHLTALECLDLSFGQSTCLLPEAGTISLLPQEVPLQHLIVRVPEAASWQAAYLHNECLREFFDKAAGVKQLQRVQQLTFWEPSTWESRLFPEVLHSLSTALPNVTVLTVSWPSLQGEQNLLSQVLPTSSVFPTLQTLHQEGTGPPMSMSLSDLDVLIHERPALTTLPPLNVYLTPACLTQQQEYEHIARMPKGTAVALKLCLREGDSEVLRFMEHGPSCDDWCNGMQLEALPFSQQTGWHAANDLGYVHVGKGAEAALGRLASLLKPLPSSLMEEGYVAQEIANSTLPSLMLSLAGEAAAIDPAEPAAEVVSVHRVSLRVVHSCSVEGDTEADLAAVVLEACCLHLSITHIHVTVHGKLLHAVGDVDAHPIAGLSMSSGTHDPAMHAHATTGVAIGAGAAASSSNPAFERVSGVDAGDVDSLLPRGCWRDFVMGLSVHAPQLQQVVWHFTGHTHPHTHLHALPHAWGQAAACALSLTGKQHKLLLKHAAAETKAP